MKAPIVAGVVALAVAAGGWFGWGAYESRQETNAAVQATQASALIFERQAEARKEDGVTFAEFLSRSNSALEAMDKEALQLSSKTWNRRPEDRDKALAFISECKVMTRLGASEVRLILDESGIQKSYDEAQKELDQATSSDREWKLKRFRRASDDLIAVIDKKLELVKESIPKIERFLAADDVVKASFGDDKGMSRDLSDRLRKYITPPKDDPSPKG